MVSAIVIYDFVSTLMENLQKQFTKLKKILIGYLIGTLKRRPDSQEHLHPRIHTISCCSFKISLVCVYMRAHMHVSYIPYILHCNSV